MKATILEREVGERAMRLMPEVEATTAKALTVVPEVKRAADARARKGGGR